MKRVLSFISLIILLMPILASAVNHQPLSH